MGELMKQTLTLLIVIVLTSIVIFTNYTLIDHQVQESLIKNPRNFFRDVDTDAKRWLNGHLGMFFRFRYFGNVVWMALPILVFLLFTFRRRERWQLALMFVLTVLLIIIGLKGARNARYQFTVFPILLTMTLTFFWEEMKYAARWVRLLLLLFLAGLCLFNIVHYLNWYGFFWQMTVVDGKKNFPKETVRYLKEIREKNPASRILVCNQPYYFYYIEGGGVDYRHPEAKLLLRTEGNRRELFGMLRRLGIRFILFDFRVAATQKAKVFSEIVNLDCNQVLSEGGVRLVEMRERPFEESIPPNAFKTILIWNSGASDPADTAPLLRSKGHPWKFFLEFEKTDHGNILRAVPKKVVKSRKLIDFGFTFDRQELRIEEGGQVYVYFTVSAKISKGAIGRESYIYVRDYTDNTEQEKLLFAKPGWRTYLVRKQIRFDAQKISARIVFVPKQSDDELAIRDMQVFLLNHRI